MVGAVNAERVDSIRPADVASDFALIKIAERAMERFAQRRLVADRCVEGDLFGAAGAGDDRRDGGVVEDPAERRGGHRQVAQE